MQRHARRWAELRHATQASLRRVTRAATCVQSHARGWADRRHAAQASLRRATRAAICVQRHARRCAAATERPFVMRLRRQLVLVMLTPIAWLAWMLAVANVQGVPFFWAKAMLLSPFLMVVALSVTAHLRLGPAWCKGGFLAKLGLRVFVCIHPLIVLDEIMQQASSSPEMITENAAFFRQVLTPRAAKLSHRIMLMCVCVWKCIYTHIYMYIHTFVYVYV